MTPSNIFSIVNMVTMIMWILMIFTPKWKVTKSLMKYKVIPIGLAVVYAIFIVKSILISGGMDFGSLESVMALFTEENAVLGGWIHYLAFDLLIGMWILKQNEKLQINHLLIIPCLIGTFMMGPIGFLLFMIIKTLKTN